MTRFPTLPLTILSTLLIGLGLSSVAGAQDQKVAFEVNFANLGLAEDASPSEARMTVAGLTLTVSAGSNQLNNASKGKALGVAGNRTGQINADETLTLTFDRDVVLNRMDFNGLKQKDESQPAESARVSIAALDLEFTVTHDVVAPDHDKIQAKAGDRVTFKGKKFRLPAGEPIVLEAAGEETRFTFQGITVQTADENSDDDSEPQ